MKKQIVLLTLILTLKMATAGIAAWIEEKKVQDGLEFTLNNGNIHYLVEVKKGKIHSETAFFQSVDNPPFFMKTDGNFRFVITWTDWHSPGKTHNADNPASLDKNYFSYKRHEITDKEDYAVLDIYLKGEAYIPQFVKLTYRLEKEDFYIRKKISIQDTLDQTHFLNSIWPLYARFENSGMTILKPGGFGNPAALSALKNGAFFGMEYPAAENSLQLNEKDNRFTLKCGQNIGEKITAPWLESDWAVIAVTPDERVKYWFNEYLKEIRAVPLKPYLLYNSWYDVRSETYTERPEDIMNEENVLRIARDFKRELYEKRGITLDAFVLDDGWDVYESDWVLRKKEFPNGFKPISRELKKMGTDFGIWFGPTGGYSYRMKRINWMKEHGYETVGHEYRYNKAMLCLAGKKYKELFKKRVVDFVKNEGVSYYKWDGIQFACSEPDHGHPVGIYSRRAVMNSVIEICDAVRDVNPNMYLNITSGTWLSPWWMKYANMIWMQGGDYGYANVPSISERDAAITYRDYVLYDNYGVNDFWFPISNLMTHGIIKGHLQKLGGEKEPLDKFTDNSILYFARGVSMWELYVSPNLLTEGEWNAIAQSIRWAKDRFDILKSTEMIGGNPGKKEAYGYLHAGPRQVIAALRNPFAQEQKIKIPLSHQYGLEKDVGDLVVERVYPNRWISPQLVSEGSEIEITLDGYETAIYEIRPLKDAKEPLLAGLIFHSKQTDGGYEWKVYHQTHPPVLLNPQSTIAGWKLPELNNLDNEDKLFEMGPQKMDDGEITLDIKLNSLENNQYRLALLIEPAVKLEKEKGIKIQARINKEETAGEKQGRPESWQWAIYPLNTVENRIKLTLENLGEKFKGRVSVYLISRERPEPEIFTIPCSSSTPSRVTPPLPYPVGTKQKHSLIKEWML